MYLSHPASLAHDTGAHPERAARIRAIEAELTARGWLGLRRVEAPAVERAALEAVHPAAYVDWIERVCTQAPAAIDADTVVSSGSWAAALHAAGGAMALVDLLLTGEAPVGCAALRPPGHHAEASRAMGFCLFNNVAIAARRALDAHGLERVLILDWDVHHGNGTNDIFHASSQVLYISLHQSPLYPGSGPASDGGSGPGLGYTVNVPLPAGSDDAAWTSVVEHVAVPIVRAYEPQLVLISAGYDAHREDPLGGCRLSEAGYATMTQSLTRLAGELAAPIGIVLEGGYDLGALSRSLAATLAVLGGAPAPAPPSEPDPLARAAAVSLERHWGTALKAALAR